MKKFLLGGLLLMTASLYAQQKPNVIFILTDDMGYGDLGCYGHPLIRTPFLDGMAAKGVRATDYTVSSPTCSPSRASLLTGRYATRMHIPYPLGPGSEYGLPVAEVTIAEMLHQSGYKNYMVGKWHLGDKDSSSPIHQGFDHYFGMMYSHDFRAPYVQTDTTIKIFRDGTPVISRPEDSTLTDLYTRETIDIIKHQKKGQPFFIYLAHNMPHLPIWFAAQKHYDHHSAGGEYGDIIEELDRSIAAVWKALQDQGLADNTIFMFSSDNGPWSNFPARMSQDGVTRRYHAGTAGMLRGSKFTTYEGGDRVPFIVYWKGHTLPGVTVTAPLSNLDILPTLAEWTHTPLPKRELDGQSVAPWLTQKNYQGEHQPFYYAHGNAQVVRKGEWKLRRTKQDGKELLELYNMTQDPGERENMADHFPDKVKALTVLLDAFPGMNP